MQDPVDVCLVDLVRRHIPSASFRSPAKSGSMAACSQRRFHRNNAVSDIGYNNGVSGLKQRVSVECVPFRVYPRMIRSLYWCWPSLPTA